MRIELKRKYKKANYTIGNLYVDGVFFCNTIEDRVIDWSKQQKVKGYTAIPAGRYAIIMTYSPKFKCRMPLLCNVPHFQGIRIHWGVDENSTEGCVIVGDNKIVGKVVNSRARYNELSARIDNTLNRGEYVYIDITE